jgi:hypothetical protein
LIPPEHRDAVRAFAKAVIWGGVGGALPFLLIAVPVGTSLLGQGQIAIAVWTMILPLLVAWPITLAAALIIGPPITWLMDRIVPNRGGFYVLAGLIAGSLPFLVTGLFPGAIGWMAFAIPGGMAGAVAGWHWGRHRDRVAALNQTD